MRNPITITLTSAMFVLASGCKQKPDEPAALAEVGSEQITREDLLFQVRVASDVGTVSFGDLALLQEHGQTTTCVAAVVAHDREILGLLAIQFCDHVFRDPA